MDIGRDAHRVKSLSRHTLEQMVTRSSEGILLADAQDPGLPIVYANPAYEALTGYTVEELAGHSWPLDWKLRVTVPKLSERIDAIFANQLVRNSIVPTFWEGVANAKGTHRGPCFVEISYR